MIWQGPVLVACVLAAVVLAPSARAAEEKQLTNSPKNHMLDNNDNFSSDGKFLAYDTREMYGSGLKTPGPSRKWKSRPALRRCCAKPRNL